MLRNNRIQLTKKKKPSRKVPLTPFGCAPTTHEKCLNFVLNPTSANGLLYQLTVKKESGKSTC